MLYEQSFVPKMGGNSRIDLVQQIKLLNEGKYLHDVMHVDNRSDFLYWVQVILKTFESIITFRFETLKEKVDAGADYVVQMFLTMKIFSVCCKSRQMGITVPIIPYQTTAVQRHLQILPQIFRIGLPEGLING
jgi:methylenetetrahydrofolate reductase (NADPH)